MSGTKRVSNRALIVAGLIVSLLIAGVASFYASSNPDGLEYVAEQTGFADAADEDPTTTGSPFEDYGTSGVDNERLSGGIAGVAGVLITLLVGGGLFYLLRRRDHSAEDATPAEASETVER